MTIPALLSSASVGAADRAKVFRRREAGALAAGNAVWARYWRVRAEAAETISQGWDGIAARLAVRKGKDA